MVRRHRGRTMKLATLLIPVLFLAITVEAVSPTVTTATFTSKDSLKEAVQAFIANPASAIATYGPIADWDVSAITDMSYLFQELSSFNTDISNWNTSGVTSMDSMFAVRSARALCLCGPLCGPL